MNKIVLDIETRNTFRDVGANDPTKLDISVVVAYDYATDRYHHFLQEDLPALWKMLEQTDILIGYNSDYFDIPLLAKYHPGSFAHIKSIDLLQEIHKTLNRRVRLDDVAHATLGTHKSGHGLDAIEWWKNGEIEKIKKYCEDDVRITKELYEYALRNGHLKYKDLLDIKEIPLDTGTWETITPSSAIHCALPF